MKLPIRNAALRYGLVPGFIACAVLWSQFLHPLLPHLVEYVFLAAVVSAAWLGGRGPGLLAAVLAPFVLDYFFYPPLYTLGISNQARPYVVPFLLCGLAAAWMSSMNNAARDTRELLRQTREKFRRILANLPDVAWTMQQDRRILYMSPKVERVLGFSSEEIRSGAGDLLLKRIHPDDFERAAQSWNDLFATRRPLDLEYRIQARNGDWLWIHNRAICTYSENGQVLADGIFSDITSRKQAEIDLRSKTAFLEALVNSTRDGIFAVDAGNRPMLGNDRFIQMFSIPEDMLNDGDDQRMMKYALSLVKDPESFLARVQYLYSHPDEASEDEVELTDGRILDRFSTAVADQAGNYYGRIWTFRDFTERRRSEDALRQLSAAVEQSPVSVVITDPQANITYVNRKFTECTGYSLEELLGRNPRIFNSGYTPRETYRALWSTIRQGREWHGLFQNKKKNGEMYWEETAITPLKDRNGAITHFLAIKVDITERRAMESELRQAQKLEGIGQLAAGIAHEINTPTQFVTDNLTFLQDSWNAAYPLLKMYRSAIYRSRDVLPPATVEALKEAEQRCDIDFISEEVPRAISQSIDGARRVAAIVRAMKEFSHPDSPDKADTDLNKAIESTITVCRNEWKYVAELVTEFDPALPPVFCYPGEVNQVILNLVVNAAHAIKDKTQGLQKGRIVISTRLRGQSVEIAVADTGMGIPKEIQTRVYEPFFTTKEVGKGTGQGLALAHSVVVKKHQGKIWFESEEGVGTTFFIQLPIAHAVVPAGTS